MPNKTKAQGRPKGLEDGYLTRRGWRGKGSEYLKNKTQEVEYQRDDWGPQWDSTDSITFGPIRNTLDPEFACHGEPNGAVIGGYALTVGIRYQEMCIEMWLEALNYVCPETFEVVGGPQECEENFTILMDGHPIHIRPTRHQVIRYLEHYMKLAWFDPFDTDGVTECTNGRPKKHELRQDKPYLYAWMIEQGLKNDPQPYARW